MDEKPSAEYLKDYCGRKPGVTSGHPFGGEHLVFKVLGKIFAVMNVQESPVKVTFKADPELTGLLRGQILRQTLLEHPHLRRNRPRRRDNRTH